MILAIFQSTNNGNTASISWTLTDTVTNEVVNSGSQSYTYTRPSTPGACPNDGWGNNDSLATKIPISLPSRHPMRIYATSSGGGPNAICTVEFDTLLPNGGFSASKAGYAQGYCEQNNCRIQNFTPP